MAKSKSVKRPSKGTKKALRELEQRKLALAASPSVQLPGGVTWLPQA